MYVGVKTCEAPPSGFAVHVLRGSTGGTSMLTHGIFWQLASWPQLRGLLQHQGWIPIHSLLAPLFSGGLGGRDWDTEMEHYCIYHSFAKNALFNDVEACPSASFNHVFARLKGRIAGRVSWASDGYEADEQLLQQPTPCVNMNDSLGVAEDIRISPMPSAECQATYIL